MVHNHNDAEHPFRLIAEAASNAMILVSKEGKIVFVNTQAEKLFCFKRTELVGHAVEMLIPTYSAVVKQGYSAPETHIPVSQNGLFQTAEMKFTAKKKDGSSFSAEIVLSHLGALEDGLVLIVVINMTEKRRTEEKLLLFASIVNSSDDAIISKTITGEITTWNHAAEEIFGYSSAEIIGHSISTLVPTGLLEEEKEIMKKIFKGEIVDHYETERVRKDGTVINVTLTISPIKDSYGNITGASNISRDITERKKNEEEKEKRASELIIANKELAFQNSEKEKRADELIVANKELVFQNNEKEKRAIELTTANDELESFSYSVSHDLRAPLRAVHGFAQMLQEDCGAQLDAEGNRKLETIMKNAKKMGQLIDDLLTFSRLGRRDLQVSDIRMYDLVQGVCQELKNEQGDRNIEFNVQQLLPAKADNVTIKQVWVNLISNAIKYSRLKDKTVIEINSELKGDEIIYSVKDNGAGFDMRYADKLFGVFQRLHADNRFEGTGVGLAIVRRIISKHKGRTWAEGKLEEGATFYFTLNKI